MQVPLPIFFFCLLVHAGIYLTSSKQDKKTRLIAGLVILLLTWPIWYGGSVLITSAEPPLYWLGIFLARAPYYLPFLSFLAYIRLKKAVSMG